MSDFTDTAQRLAPRLGLPASHVTGVRRHREPLGEPWESVWTWARFAAAGIVIAWLLSLGAFGAAAPAPSATLSGVEPGNAPTGDVPTLHRDGRPTTAEAPAAF